MSRKRIYNWKELKVDESFDVMLDKAQNARLSLWHFKRKNELPEGWKVVSRRSKADPDFVTFKRIS